MDVIAMSANRCCLALITMAVAILPAVAHAAGQGGRCGVLVTEQECRAYLERLENAASAAERGNLESEHALMIKERARFCHEGRDQTSKTEARPAKPTRNPPQKIWM